MSIAVQEAISMKLAVCFTNFGPYHLARLRALAVRLRAEGSRLIAYEVASSEQKYPWCRSRSDEPFEWNTFFPHRTLETILARRLPPRDRREHSIAIVRMPSAWSVTRARSRWSEHGGRAGEVCPRS